MQDTYSSKNPRTRSTGVQSVQRGSTICEQLKNLILAGANGTRAVLASIVRHWQVAYPDTSLHIPGRAKRSHDKYMEHRQSSWTGTRTGTASAASTAHWKSDRAGHAATHYGTRRAQPRLAQTLVFPSQSASTSCFSPAWASRLMSRICTSCGRKYADACQMARFVSIRKVFSTARRTTRIPTPDTY